MAKKYREMIPETLEEILARYNPDDHGYGGKTGEIIVRKAVAEKVERLHPAGLSDCTVKRGVALEIKTGAGELDTFGYDTKEQALEAKEADRYLPGCTHVAYLAKFTGNNVEDFIVVSRKRFINLLKEHNLVRVKRGSDDKWRVTIQNYLPTPNFHPSKERAASFFMGLEENGYYLDIFVERMLQRDLNLD